MQIHSNGVTLDIDPKVLERMKADGHPLVLKIDGKAEVVVLDAESYQRMLDEIDEQETVEAIREGLEAADAGRVVPLEDFEKEFRARYGIPRRSD